MLNADNRSAMIFFIGLPDRACVTANLDRWGFDAELDTFNDMPLNILLQMHVPFQ